MELVNEPFSIPSPAVTSPQSEINVVPYSTEQEVSNMELVNDERPDANRINALPAETIEPTQGWSQEEAESTEPELEELNETSDNGSQKQKTTTGDLSDLFTDEFVEEDDVSKLAKSLNDVDVHDLIREGRNLVNELKGTKG